MMFTRFDCGGLGVEYMVTGATWQKAVTRTEMPEKICLHCLEARLGRQLTESDFDFSLQINAGIARGVLMGRERVLRAAQRSARKRLA